MSRSKEELQMLQSLPLDVKIRMTQTRIRQWVHEYGSDNVYISFSGGKDSTVLLDIVRDIYSDIEAVFVNTGLEYPEIQQFVKTFPNVTILRPKMRFDEVIRKYGYPIISKEVSHKLHDLTSARKNGNFNSYAERQFQGNYVSKNGKTNSINIEKWKYLIDAPFKCSHKCCDVMKKKPIKQYEKQTKKKPIIGTMASESQLRRQNWVRYGCNAFEKKRPTSQPMSFWAEQDVLLYIKLYEKEMIERRKEGFRETGMSEEDIKKINFTPIASVYGDVVYETDPEQMRIEDFDVDNGGADKLITTGCNRTGCIFCAFGCHLEKEPSRFQMLKQTHPRQYEYCIGGGEYVNDVWQPNKQGLGMAHVFDELNKIYGEGFIKY